jgi:hypothetical protein
MKFLKTVCTFTLLFSVGCSHFDYRRPSSEIATVDQQVAEKYRNEINDFQMLIEEVLVWRSKALEFYQKNQDKFGKKNNFTHQDLLDVFESVKKYNILREKLFQYSKKNSAYFTTLDLVEFKPGTGTDLVSSMKRIDPKDLDGKDFVLRMKLSFAASLMLYDNYLTGIYPYVSHRKTRKLINKDIPELHNALEKITDSFFDVNQRLGMLKAQSVFKDDVEFEKKENIQIDNVERYLEMLAVESPFYQFLLTKHFDLKKQNAVKAYWDRVVDNFTFINDSFTFIASKTFGNTLGLVSFRAGYLTKLSEEERKQMEATYKPLDIMMEKTPFRLTDQFIPGYYGHVALWIGTEEELKEIGVWDNPLVQKYHEAIRSGRHIIEALRPGVQINSLEHFLNIDDLLVVRHNNLTEEQKAEYILRAFAQIGKEYDFNFDVETDSKIVCSEIVYVVFHDIEWPTKKQLGRYTISPDNVANKCVDGTLEPVMMFRSGKRIDGSDNIIQNLKEELNSK